MNEINDHKFNRIQKILLRLYICMLLIVTYFTLNAYAATEPKAKAFYISISLMLGVGVAWIHIQAWIRRYKRREKTHE